MSQFPYNQSWIDDPPLSFLKRTPVSSIGAEQQPISSFMKRDSGNYSGFHKMRQVRTPNDLSFLELAAFVTKIGEELPNLMYLRGISRSEESAIFLAINAMSLVFLYKTMSTKQKRLNPEEQNLEYLVDNRVDSIKCLLQKQPILKSNVEFSIKDDAWNQFIKALKNCQDECKLSYKIVKPIYYDIMIKVYRDLVGQIKKNQTAALNQEYVKVVARIIYSISLTRKKNNNDFFCHYVKWHSSVCSLNRSLTDMSLEELDQYFKEAKPNHLMEDVNHLINTYLNQQSHK